MIFVTASYSSAEIVAPPEIRIAAIVPCGRIAGNLTVSNNHVYGVPDWAPHSLLSAAAAGLALAAATITAAAQQQDQDDDPAHITAAETAITTKVTHINTSKILMRLSMPLIPWYSAKLIWCRIFLLSIIVDILSQPILLLFGTFSAMV